MAHTCPECGSEEVTVAHIQKFMANGGDHYCHSVKTHDSDSPTTTGTRCSWPQSSRSTWNGSTMMMLSKPMFVSLRAALTALATPALSTGAPLWM